MAVVDLNKDVRYRVFPRHGWAGAALVAIAWPLNWLLPGPRTHLLFFPLWLGYVLTVDAMVLQRIGTSLLTRSWRGFLSLFLISAPAWWLFEVINWRTKNWVYVGGGHLSPIEYFALATLNFSTVIPAIFVTAEWVRTLDWMQRLERGPSIRLTAQNQNQLFIAGCLMFALLMAFPQYLYPLVWISLVFVIEPINYWLRRVSLMNDVSKGDWRTVVSYGFGALVCGFFWEMWNYFSFPKWEYRIPFLGFGHVFEMPVLGYLGYIPFALELVAIVHFIRPRYLQLHL